MSLPDATVNKNMEGHGARASVQRFGGFLAGMIMPNIGAFIAWGLITALFIDTGWAPNKDLATMVSPMITYLLTLLIGYTGGRMVHGQRGAVIGAIATMGVIVGTTVPMFLGAMIVGPGSAWILKQFDKLWEGKVKEGFEMLVDTFSLGIIGGGLAIVAHKLIGPIVQWLMNVLAMGVDALIKAHLLPLVSLIVEPGKVLFLNNAMNHGIMTPLGTQQAQAAGKSILFMVESNPGPGFGMLLAIWAFGNTAKLRGSAPGAIIIHLLGGIHEIYFPYILMMPKLILSTIAGGMAGLAVGVQLGAGLVAPASPGSILAWMAMTPKGGFGPVLADFGTATIVSFAVAALLLAPDHRKSRKHGEPVEETAAPTAAAVAAPVADAAAATSTATAATATTTAKTVNGHDVSHLYIACDAGMGSSVMVASTMKKKLASAGVEVSHTPVDQIPVDANLVMCHEGLADRARQKAPQAVVVPFSVYMGDPAFTMVEDAIKNGENIG